MERLVVIANRLPYSIIKRDGEFIFHPSPGGLAVGLSSLPESFEKLWIGWPGVPNDKLTSKDKTAIISNLKEKNCLPVFLSQKQNRVKYYIDQGNSYPKAYKIHKSR